MKPLAKNKCNVVCEWMQSKRVIINPDGQIVPCCFIANVLYPMNKITSTESIQKDIFPDPVLEEYYSSKQKYNIHNRPIDQILSDDWFTSTLPESWNDSDRIPLQCWWNCSPDGKISGKTGHLHEMYAARKKHKENN